MATNDTPLSGAAYTLRELLNGEVSLIVPDMQRDYCWGSEGVSAQQPHERVSGCISGVVSMYAKGNPLNMGLIYGYSIPERTSNILIVDGQQRLTTLYLLLGMLYRRTPRKWLRQLLISDYELLDDHRPRLVYQARNEAFYFLSDLVTNFFLDRNGRLSQLELSPWYFSSYDTDPTVRSFISAIRHIDRVLEQASSRSGWDFDSFALYVVDNLHFVYYDLGSRGDAESMFITINTTSQPLTRAQTAKMRMYGRASDKDDFVRRWEAMDHWCWRHRAPSEATSDAAMARVLDVWGYFCELKKSAVSDFDEDRFFAFFTAFSQVCAEVPQALERQDVSSPGDMMLLVPSIVYILRWGSGVGRLWVLLSNVQLYQKALSSGADTLTALRMVESMPDSDILSLLKVQSGNERILNREEVAKLQLIADNRHQRGRVEAVIDRGQAHPLLGGRLSKVMSWCVAPRSHVCDIDVLERYVDMLYDIWGEDIDCRQELDAVRLALLALRHPGYPVMRRSNTSLTLCWHEYDWQRLMANSPGLVRQLIDRVAYSAKGTVADRLAQIASRCDDRTYPYNFLLRQPKLLRRCAHRTILRPCLPFMGMYVEGTNTTDWYIEQSRIPHNAEHWTQIRTYGNLCLYTDHRTYNVAIDIYYVPSQQQCYRIEVFRRSDTAQSHTDSTQSRNDSAQPRTEDVNLRALTDASPLQFRYDSSRRRFYATAAASSDILRAYKYITNQL